MASVVVEVRMLDFLVVSRCPVGIFPVVLPTRCGPLFQERDFLPHSIRVNLISKAELSMESIALNVLLEYILPHVANAAKFGSLIGINIESEIIPRVSNEAPAGLVSACDQKFIPRASQVGGDGIRPLHALVFHLKVNVVAVEHPSLMAKDGLCFELSWVWRKINALVNVDGGRLRRVSNQHDGAKPYTTLNVHIRVSQVGSKVNTIRWSDLVDVHSSRRRRPCEASCGRASNSRHAHEGIRAEGSSLWLWASESWGGKGQLTTKSGANRRRERVNKRARRREWLV